MHWTIKAKLQNIKSFKIKLMQTITIYILNNKAVRLLQDLELLQLIRMRKEKRNLLLQLIGPLNTKVQWPLTYIDNQLNELRKEWE